jgi:hypothetical protein
MNPTQMAQQIKHELQSVVWDVSDGTGEVVFGSYGVYVYAGAILDDNNLPTTFPFALVTIDQGTPDDDDPDLVEQNFTVLVAAEVFGDRVGEFAVIGSSRSSYGTSAGAGVAEVMSRARYAVQDLTGVDGAPIIISSTGIASTNVLEDNRNIAMQELTLTALCSSQEHYSPPQKLAWDGDETWTWEGSHCSSRFDFIQYRMGYVSGDEPVEEVGSLDGTVDTTGNETLTHAPTSGRTYCIFAEYQPRQVGDGTDTAAGVSDGRIVGAFVTI